MKRIFCMMNLVILMALVSVFLGCDGGDGSGGDDKKCDIKNNVYAPTTVVYSIADNGNLSWKNAADSSSYTSGGDIAWTVTWYCADYEGYKNAYVQLSFWDWEGDGLGWILEDEFIDPDGICEEECL